MENKSLERFGTMEHDRKKEVEYISLRDLILQLYFITYGLVDDDEFNKIPQKCMKILSEKEQFGRYKPSLRKMITEEQKIYIELNSRKIEEENNVSMLSLNSFIREKIRLFGDIMKYIFGEEILSDLKGDNGRYRFVKSDIEYVHLLLSDYEGSEELRKSIINNKYWELDIVVIKKIRIWVKELLIRAECPSEKIDEYFIRFNKSLSPEAVEYFRSFDRLIALVKDVLPRTSSKENLIKYTKFFDELYYGILEKRKEIG